MSIRLRDTDVYSKGYDEMVRVIFNKVDINYDTTPETMKAIDITLRHLIRALHLDNKSKSLLKKFDEFDRTQSIPENWLKNKLVPVLGKSKQTPTIEASYKVVLDEFHHTCIDLVRDSHRAVKSEQNALIKAIKARNDAGMPTYAELQSEVIRLNYLKERHRLSNSNLPSPSNASQIPPNPEALIPPITYSTQGIEWYRGAIKSFSNYLDKLIELCEDVFYANNAAYLQHMDVMAAAKKNKEEEAANNDRKVLRDDRDPIQRIVRDAIAPELKLVRESIARLFSIEHTDGNSISQIGVPDFQVGSKQSQNSGYESDVDVNNKRKRIKDNKKAIHKSKPNKSTNNNGITNTSNNNNDRGAVNKFKKSKKGS